MRKASHEALHAFLSHFILNFFGSSTEEALQSRTSIDRDQRFARNCSAPELHLLGFFHMH